MPSFIAKTHEDWASFLKEGNITDSINFWSPSPRPLCNDLSGNYLFFYAKVPPLNRRKVVGWGTVREYRTGTVLEAWGLFALGNGASSLEEIIERLNSQSWARERLDEKTVIGMSIIDDIIWLESPLDFYIHPNVVRGRRVSDDEVRQILGSYSPDISEDQLLLELSEINRQYRDSEPRQRTTISRMIERNPIITKLLKQLHNLNCQLCGCEFFYKKGRIARYSEIHHIKELSRGGSQATENCLVLCATCHSKMHHGDILLEDLGNRIRISEANEEYIVEKNIINR